MKFERINENQIRCTLNKADLADRELMINELAYGTDKAKALFREMMQQASYEVGFEAENIPLMIEAIPVSPDCLVLIITKVEDPEELDTRFSKFTKPISLDMEEDPEIGPEIPDTDEDDDITTVYDQMEQNSVPLPTGSIADTLDFLTPITNALKHAREAAQENKEKNQDDKAIQKVFLFHDMKPLLQLAPKLNTVYKEKNSLYRNTAAKDYHLLLTKGSLSTEKFGQICNLLSEYGTKISYTYASSAFYKEHFDTLIADEALKVLAEL